VSDAPKKDPAVYLKIAFALVVAVVTIVLAIREYLATVADL